jgi:hypothetical protein
MPWLYKSLAIALLLIQPASAELADENLLVTVPPGYKVDFHTERNAMVMDEMVPDNQTVDDWTEMVTVQIFHGMKIAPEAFKEGLQRDWNAACPDATGDDVANGVENGYPERVFVLDCPKNPGTGKREITWFKAIAGNDSFYVVQKAFKFEPTDEQVGHWLDYLKSVVVCDTRLAERACPQTRN